jgi:hypothetical protein
MIERLNGRIGSALTIALIIAYLSGTALLAVNVDSRFFVNDGVAIAVWLLIAVGLAFGARQAAARR